MATVVNVLVIAVDRTAARAQGAYVNRLPGFRTTATVGSAAAGLRRLAKGDVDLVLMDRRLPDADGVELAARLREQGFGGEVLLASAARGPHHHGRRSDARRRGRRARPAVQLRHVPRHPGLLGGRAACGPGTGGTDPPTHPRRPRRLPLGMRPDTLDAITMVVRECCSQSAMVLPAGRTARVVRLRGRIGDRRLPAHGAALPRLPRRRRYPGAQPAATQPSGVRRRCTGRLSSGLRLSGRPRRSERGSRAGVPCERCDRQQGHGVGRTELVVRAWSDVH